jgi:16S rRNA (cytosine1402-N4)-methyltransferase
MVGEARQYLLRASTRVIVDCTVGTGGHADELLRASARNCCLIGIDLDDEALKIARLRLSRFGGRVILKKMNFANLESAVPQALGRRADAVLIDCGISKLQIVTSYRGFSFDRDGALDMRFDTAAPKTAKSFLEGVSAKELTELLRQFGERSKAKSIARAIARLRDTGSLGSTLDLTDAVKSVVRQKAAKSLARVFLAIRAVVNDELENLARALDVLPEVLTVGGRACVISYHSGEDRVVKTLFRKLSGRCVCPPGRMTCTCGKRALLRTLTRKPILPTPEEVALNPSARSAKMRVVEKM